MTKPVYLLDIIIVVVWAVRASDDTMDITMPGVTTHQEDEYWCTSVPAPEEESYIISFQALPDGDRAHHMMLFGCMKPGSFKDKWPCHTGCADNPTIMYAWAFHAEPTHLPPDVGFRIGGPKVKYISLQVHYRVIVKGEDHSGIRMTITKDVPVYVAGIFIMAAPVKDHIPPHKKKHHIDISCDFTDDVTIYPFAYRVHAHALGRVIAGYQYNSSWHLIGKGNPQWPQAFFPMHQSVVIKPFDILIARCTYNSMDQPKTVSIGATHLDEMCNFYIMYYTKPGVGKTYYSCFGNQYPELVQQMPADSDVNLPPNPLLEKAAHGDLEGIEEVKDWAEESSDLGDISGVATDFHGNIHIFHRGTRTWKANSFSLDNTFTAKDEGPIKQDTIMTFDSSGKKINSWGKDLFYMPHGFHIDKKDNIWLTDVALHQVMRFAPGRHSPDLVLGEIFVPGLDSNHFCKPTDVATLSTGQFYVSDGYCNHRVMKFSADGKLLKQWGRSSSSLTGDGFPPPGDFSNPHSIAVSEANNILCVADRENQRIQCFDLEGNFLRQMHAPDITGRVFAVAFDTNTGALYAVNHKDIYHNDIKVQGFLFDSKSGRLIKTWSPQSDSFKQPHDITVAWDGTAVYVVELSPSKIWKFEITPSEEVHKSVKKSGHPPTVDEDDDSVDVSDELLKDAGGSDFGASLIIGGLLIIPVMIVFIITVFLRLRKNGKLHYFFGNRTRNRRLDLGTLLSRGRHRFSPLSTDDKDPELDLLNSDSEVEEYSVMENNTA